MAWVPKRNRFLLFHVQDDPHKALKDKEIVDSGCSRHMIGNKSHLADYQEFKGGYVAFGGSNGRITGKGKIKAGRLKGIKREYSNARTSQQNVVPERKNRTLIEAARTINQESIREPACKFLENKPNVAGKGHAWMFDLDYLTNSMNHEPVSLENQANKTANLQEANNSAGTQANDDQGTHLEEIDLHDEHFVLPICSAYSTTDKSSRHKIQKTTDSKTCEKPDANTNSTNLLNAVSAPVSAVGPSRALNDAEPSYPNDPSMPHLEDIYASTSEWIFTNSSYDDEAVQTRSKVKKNYESYALVSYIQKQQRNNHKDFQHCLFACFLSQVEPKNISQALEDKSWVDAMQEELLQFQIQKVWILVDLPFGKKTIRTKWVYRNKKDERGVVVRNKARLVAQGYRQEERINYNEFIAPVERIEAIRILLASYMGFIVYQMDVKSAFLYDTIDEEVYVTQPPRFVDPKFPNKVYKVVKALYGLHQAPRAWYATISTFFERRESRAMKIVLAVGNLELIVVLGNIIALLKLAIRSSVRRNNGTTNPESSCVDDADCFRIEENEGVQVSIGKGCGIFHNFRSFVVMVDGGEVGTKQRSKEGSSIKPTVPLHLPAFVSSLTSNLGVFIDRLMLLWPFRRFSSYTAIVPCLTDDKTTDSGPEPSFDGSSSPKFNAYNPTRAESSWGTLKEYLNILLDTSYCFSSLILVFLGSATGLVLPGVAAFKGGEAPESRGSGGSAPGSRVQGAAAPGRVQGILDSNLSFIRFEISIESSKYFNLKVFARLTDFCDHKFLALGERKPKKDKIRSKPDKNERRDKTMKSQKQLQ
nr:putative ribonuclease H-like domain-containing protein [Tanacetum cinerariifolium]